jgi:hypothetical protein
MSFVSVAACWEMQHYEAVRKVFWATGIFLIAASVMIAALMRTGQVRIFWTHLRTDNELDQVTVDHFRNSDYVRGIKPKPMAASDVYVGYFGGPPVLGHKFILLSLPTECASEKYILHFDRVLVPEGHIWASGPVAIWWHPQRVRNLRASSIISGCGAEFNSASCGQVRFMLGGCGG